ncbi:endoplasmic reticulum aminopeptidase 1-like [Dunckerocampus dactyliophorus]|uniref:endoplasmic reticulum aminopeptidase 1-like n=1 Tax=Dunckerocampus dactyliophorus TaxID=161453 RepID=UPI002406C871|nr:endoplasmic reticulum aminopeptidase 1-like [Dunckerocampus dactyliophorus]
MLVAPLCLLVLFVYLGSLLGAQLPYENPRDITGAHPFPWDQMRLPKTVFPVHYEMTIHPNLTTLDFMGIVRIQLEVRMDTKAIVLHAKQLKTFNVKLRTPEGVRALRVLENPYYQQLALLSDEVLTEGKDYEVQLEFSAQLSDSYHGFYKSSYRTSSGESYILELFKDLINQQKWDDSGTVSERMLRSYLLLFACIRNFTPCVTRASQLFNMWKASDGNMSLPVDVTMAVYAVGAQTSEGWDFLFEKYIQSLQTSIKSRIKTALALTPLHHKLRWMLEQSLLGEVMKTQDLPDVMVSVSRNPRGHKLAWDFIQANWQTLIKKFELGSPSVMQMVAGVTSHYSTKTMLQSVQKFFGSLKKETGSEMRCIQQAYDTINDNIRWSKSNLPILQSWLNKHNRHVHDDL